jgi:hypothetical protein
MFLGRIKAKRILSNGYQINSKDFSKVGNKNDT